MNENIGDVMRNPLIFLLAGAVLCSLPLFGEHTTVVIPPTVTAGKGDISGRLRRLEEDMEDLDKKLRNADADSKKGISLRQQREELGLKMIHEAQLFFLDYGSKKMDGRARKLMLLWKNESQMLMKTLGKIKDFPGAEELTSLPKLLKKARSGKFAISRIPRSDSALLREIQKLQKDALEDYHKQEMRNRPR
jgi:hypothetical protein